MSRVEAAIRKAALRAEMAGLRARLDPALGAQLAQHVLAARIIPPQACVAGFWPLAGEIDIRPLLDALYEAGYPLCLPETPHKGEALIFRAWQPGEALVPGRYGTFHPTGAPVTPDVVLVPLLAFDASGHRLGYGGGYYDRTLAALPCALRLGCAFAAQEVPALPREGHDLPLHAVATETALRHMGSCLDGRPS